MRNRDGLEAWLPAQGRNAISGNQRAPLKLFIAQAVVKVGEEKAPQNKL
jgi:hypothetical protein